MERLIRKILEESKRKTLDVNGILSMMEEKLGTGRFELEGGYGKFALIIECFCKQKLLSPVKSSGVYPRNLPLASRHRINTENIKGSFSSEGEENLRQELISLHP